MPARKQVRRPAAELPPAPPVPKEMTGPWVSAMLLCTRVMTEADGVPSLIRVIDQVTITVQGTMRDGRQVPIRPEQMTDEQYQLMPAMPLTIQLMLRGGPAEGDHVIQIVGEDPTGRRQMVAVDNRAQFSGTVGAFNTVLEIAAHLRAEGLYWFDVFCDGRLLTRMPFQVLFDGPVQVANEPESK